MHNLGKTQPFSKTKKDKRILLSFELTLALWLGNDHDIHICKVLFRLKVTGNVTAQRIVGILRQFFRLFPSGLMYFCSRAPELPDVSAFSF